MREPLRLLFINPNSTESMTAGIVAAARAAAPAGVAVAGLTSRGGPPAIEGAEDGARAVPPLLEELRRAAHEPFDAIVIACFDDTGLAEARAASTVPVIGIGQAAFHAAALRADRFSVVTTTPASVPVIEGNLRASGLAAACTGVVSSDLRVLDLERAPAFALDRLRTRIADVLNREASGAVVLGCAGMAVFAPALADELRIPVIDGVSVACGLAAALALVPSGVRRPPPPGRAAAERGGCPV